MLEYKRRIIQIVFLVVLISIFSCKSESSSDIPSSDKTLEDIYFEDYESPKELWTFIDTSGKEIFKPQYDNLRDFNNGLAIANKKGRWGVIDSDNKVVIPFKHKEIKEGLEGFFICKNFNNGFSIVDNTNRLFRDSLILDELRTSGNEHYCFKKNGAWGVKNKNFETTIDAQYSSISIFQNNHFIASLNGKDVLIDKNGNTIFRGNRLDWIEKKILINQNQYNFNLISVVNAKTDTLFTEYGEASYNGNGQLMISERGRTRFYNFQTKLYSTYVYPIIEALGNNLWSIYDQGFLGTATSERQIVHSPKYNIIHPFRDGLAVVGKNDLWGYIDAVGNEIIPLQYYLAWDYNNGMARVFTDKGIAFINKKGETVLAGNPKYFEVKDFKEGYARVQKR